MEMKRYKVEVTVLRGISKGNGCAYVFAYTEKQATDMIKAMLLEAKHCRLEDMRCKVLKVEEVTPEDMAEGREAKLFSELQKEVEQKHESYKNN